MRSSRFSKWFLTLVLCVVIMALTGCNTGPSQAQIEANKREIAEREAREKREKAAKLEAARAKAEAARLRRLDEERKLAEAQAKAKAEELRIKAELAAKAKAEAEAKARAEAEKQAAETRARVDARRAGVLGKCQELSKLAEQLSKASLRSDQIATGSTDELKKKASAAKNQVATYTRKLGEAQAKLADTPPSLKWRCMNRECPVSRYAGGARRPADGRCGSCGQVLVKCDPNAQKRLRLQAEVTRYQRYVESYKRQAEQAEAALQGKSGKVSQGAKIDAQARKLDDLQAQANGASTLEQMDAIERGVAGVESTLGVIKNSLPAGLVRTATRQPGQSASGTGKKVYVLKNGSRIEVLSEMKAGDDIIVKTPSGMVNIKKGDIAQTLKE